ncbi:MAG TPA: hypothetical protein VL475_07215 [Planctomycetaceae bacterium]|nr:hypothetical protein [Planctomycetaceae bacterium]
MIDIIFGDVFVVFARFLATDVVTLRCNRLSDMPVSIFRLRPARCGGLRRPKSLFE